MHIIKWIASTDDIPFWQKLVKNGILQQESFRFFLLAEFRLSSSLAILQEVRKKKLKAMSYSQIFFYLPRI